MAVNLHRIATGNWPEPHVDAGSLHHPVTTLWGPLGVNLAHGDLTARDKTGYLILGESADDICVWVEGVASTYNAARCP